jgi:acyl carrier protein
MSDVETSILTFIAEMQEGGGQTVASDTQLLETGVLDSIALVRLIQFVEEKFGIAIPDDDVTPDTFASPADLAAYVEQRVP